MGPVHVFEHSWNLTRGRFWRLAAYWLLVVGPSYGVRWVQRDDSMAEAGVLRLTVALVGIVFEAAWAVFGNALVLQLWYRLRAEKEGLGMERAASEIDPAWQA
jgi:hypothetical protein